MMKTNKILVLLISFLTFSFGEANTDIFGFKKKFKTKEGSYSWDSKHWGNGNARLLDNWQGDEDDPTQWTDDRSSDEGGFYVDGKGVLEMRGSGPRFHINGVKSWVDKKQFFLNVEYTGYFKRNALGGKDYGGMVVGVRSGALGHNSSGGNVCDANTYYARFRNDGKWDFEKEWKHPGSYYRSGSGVGFQDFLWNGSVLPVNQWIGMKYIVYNKDAETVRLELYIDSSSNASPPGKWELVGIAEDSGLDWPGASDGALNIEGCSDYNGLLSSLGAITKGGGVVIMRTDEDNPYYQYVSVREIDPEAPFIEDDSFFSGEISSSSQQSSTAIKKVRKSMENESIYHFDSKGRLIKDENLRHSYQKKKFEK